MIALNGAYGSYSNLFSIVKNAQITFLIVKLLITTQITFPINFVRHDSTWSRQTGRANRFIVPRTRLFGSPDRLQRPDVANHRAHNFVEAMRTTHSSRTLFVTFILIITNMILLAKESTLFCWKSFDETLFKEWKQAEYFRRTDFWLMQL